jgi:Mn2+/Fe2+ NRAMP family transporter
MLFWSAVINGIVAVPLMIAMMIVVINAGIMGKSAAPPMLSIFGWCATGLMVVVVGALLVTSAGG